jgi:dipeptidyl-peptidase 4
MPEADDPDGPDVDSEADVVVEGTGDDTIAAAGTEADVIEDAEVVAVVDLAITPEVAASGAAPPPAPAPDAAEAVSFPRLHARTQRFTLGEPRTVTVSADGALIFFLRSGDGQDPINCLWVVDAATGEERLLADPGELLGGDDGDDLPREELARRERTREAAGGITTYAIDRLGTLATFALAGRLFTCDVDNAECRELPVDCPVFDPRPDPSGRRVSYVCGRTLCVAELDGSWRVLAGGDDEPATVSWGAADFIAAEEMHRHRGYWWSPDGSAIATTRVDAAPITTAWISDSAQPTNPPRQVAYPFAGTANAEVSLHLIGLDGAIVDVEWDRESFPYLAEVHWTQAGLIISTQSRSQQDGEILDVDVATGATEVRFGDHDDRWVELVAGTPRLWTAGELVNCADREGARRLLVDGEAVTPADLQVRSIVAADDGGIVFIANPIDDATVAHIWRYVDGRLEALTDEPGVHTAAAAGGTVVIRTATLDEPRAYWDTLDGIELTSFAATPNLTLNASVHFLGVRRLATTVLLPNGHDGASLPVLLDPYGGPHALRSLRSHVPHLVSQWFADQGFAVVVTDGRGTPGRGSEWERAIHGDLATAALEDQIDALEQAAAELGCLDLDRVAIRGWSFGGYLAALAVLLRPDRIHAAVAGAPVTEWRLYDTHYTERYLGDPNDDSAAYDGSSLLPLADGLSRPLLLIHGLADDNVVAAHTLQLSSELLAAGCPHEVLPLVGVTHMTPQEVVAENLLLHQLDFLRRALDLQRPTDASAPS